MAPIENPLLPIALSLLLGLAGAASLLRKGASKRVWFTADMIWVLLGLFGGFIAILAGTYKADSSRLERQIEIAHAATATFDRDAGRFRLRHCETPTSRPVEVLCERTELLHASITRNAELPLFLAGTAKASPWFGLFPRDKPPDRAALEAASAQIDAFDPGTLLTFHPLDEATREALKQLQKSDPATAGDYRLLAQSYETLIAQLRRLKAEWAFLQDRAWVLAVQTAALCLVSFAAPFRLGKSIAQLRQG